MRSLSKETLHDLGRMLPWLMLSIVCYAVALGMTSPQLQVLFWKLGHINVGAHLGYWIARKALGRLYPDNPSGDRIARAIVIAACMLAISQGL